MSNEEAQALSEAHADDRVPNDTKEADEAIAPFEDEEAYYQHLDNVDATAQKYVNLLVLTEFPKTKIEDILGVSAYKRRQWDQDPAVQRFKREVQQDYQEGKMEAVKKRNAWMADQVFQEMFRRFQDPDPDADLRDDHTIEERMQYLDQFFEKMSAKNMMKFWEKINEHIRLDTPDEATQRVDGVQPEKVRARREQIEKRRRMYKEKKEDGEESTQSVEAEDEGGEAIDAELVEKESEGGEDETQEVVEEEEVRTIEEFQIK